jgi:hypothetical protein
MDGPRDPGYGYLGVGHYCDMEPRGPKMEPKDGLAQRKSGAERSCVATREQQPARQLQATYAWCTRGSKSTDVSVTYSTPQGG